MQIKIGYNPETISLEVLGDQILEDVKELAVSEQLYNSFIVGNKKAAKDIYFRYNRSWSRNTDYRLIREMLEYHVYLLGQAIASKESCKDRKPN